MHGTLMKLSFLAVGGDGTKLLALDNVERVPRGNWLWFQTLAYKFIIIWSAYSQINPDLTSFKLDYPSLFGRRCSCLRRNPPALSIGSWGQSRWCIRCYKDTPVTMVVLGVSWSEDGGGQRIFTINPLTSDHTGYEWTREIYDWTQGSGSSLS